MPAKRVCLYDKRTKYTKTSDTKSEKVFSLKKKAEIKLDKRDTNKHVRYRHSRKMRGSRGRKRIK
jgi:hypothetical protein